MIVLLFLRLWSGRQGRQKRVLLFYYYYIIHRIPRISYPQMPFPSSKTPFRPHAPCRWRQLPNRRNLNKSHSNHHPTASPFPCHLQHPQQSRRSSPSLPHDAEWLIELCYLLPLCFWVQMEEGAGYNSSALKIIDVGGGARRTDRPHLPLPQDPQPKHHHLPQTEKHTRKWPSPRLRCPPARLQL